MVEAPFFYIVTTQTFVELPPSVFRLPSAKIRIDPAISWGLDDGEIMELLVIYVYIYIYIHVNP